MFKVAWSRRALADIDRLEDFLHGKSPHAAARAVLTIVGAADELATFAERGRPARGNYRELTIRFSNSGYLLIYAVSGNTVRIVRVRHMREAGY